MNQAVGTLPGKNASVHGPWLDGNHGHIRGHRFHTYGKLSDVVRPEPSRLWVLLDEDEHSINDAAFAVPLAVPKWIDWPGTYHNMAGGFSFMDGHAEVHKWLEGSTRVVNQRVAQKSVPGSRDMAWIQERTSAVIYR